MPCFLSSHESCGNCHQNPSGTLPCELGTLIHLQYLRLAVTKLEGQIPDTLGEIKGGWRDVGWVAL